MSQLKEQHDQLLALKPEGVEHDTASCNFCSGVPSDPQGGETMTYTEDDVKAAVDEALAPVLTELNALKASQAESQVDARITEAMAEAEKALAEAKADLDMATARADAAELHVTHIETYLAEVAAAVEAAVAAEERKAERVEAIKAVASFKDDHIEKNADRWASMAQEEFDVLLEDLASIGSPAPELDDLEKVPESTAMNHTRSTNKSTATSEVFGLLRASYDQKP